MISAIVMFLLTTIVMVSAFTLAPGRVFALRLQQLHSSIPGLPNTAGQFGRCSFGPGSRAPMDVKESEESFRLILDLPGVDKDNIYVGVDEGVLTIKATRETFKEEESGNYRRVERSSGEVCRCLSLPKTVDTSKIDAEYVDGVLSVDIRKFSKEELDAKVTRIPVK